MALIDLGERNRIDRELAAVASHFESVDEYLSAIMRELVQFKSSLDAIEGRLQRLEGMGGGAAPNNLANY